MIYPEYLPCPCIQSYAHTTRLTEKFLGYNSYTYQPIIEIQLYTESNEQFEDFMIFYTSAIKDGTETFQWQLPLEGVLDYLWTVRIITDLSITKVSPKLTEITFSVEVIDDVRSILEGYAARSLVCEDPVDCDDVLKCLNEDYTIQDPIIGDFSYDIIQLEKFLGNLTYDTKTTVNITLAMPNNARLLEFFKFYHEILDNGINSFSWKIPIAGFTDRFWDVVIVSDVTTTYITHQYTKVTFKIQLLDSISSIYWVDENGIEWVDESADQWLKE